jgi:hypothetical protein
MKAFKIRYVFNEKHLPVGLAREHGEFAREQLGLLFDLSGDELQVSSNASDDPDQDFTLEAYSSRTTTSPPLMVEAAKCVLPHLRYIKAVAKFNADRLELWTPNSAGWYDQYVLGLIAEQRMPALSPAQRKWLVAQIAAYHPFYSVADTDEMTDHQLAEEVLHAWDTYGESTYPYGREIFIISPKKESF